MQWQATNNRSNSKNKVGGSLGAPKSGSLRAPKSGSLGAPKSDTRDTQRWSSIYAQSHIDA